MANRSQRRPASTQDWSKPVALGGGWRIQYHKESGEEFTHYRLLPPPQRPCGDGSEPRPPRLVAFDSLRVLPWLQRQFKGAEGTRLFRPVACREPGAVERAQRAVRAVDAQARVELDSAPPR
jgi:hypothetical protein